MNERFKIDNVAISIINLEEAVCQILEKAKSKVPAYVCVTNVRATYIGNHDESFCRILNNSFLTVPDGKPLEWYAYLSGLKMVKRASGPDIFNQICHKTENTELTHFFYGSSPEVIQRMEENLKRKWPALKIAGFVSPPFVSAEELANSNIIQQINQLKPTFVWIGLGAPKQEWFMDLIIKKIESSILIGVGLVFDYQAGTVKRAPFWMQKSGLEWLYRILQQPGRVNTQSILTLLSIIPLIVKVIFLKIRNAKSRV